MSQDAASRALARENRIWTPFLYSFPFDSNQTADRVTIFGLYANSYLNGQAYLIEIETAELANLLADYNAKISELTTQEQVVVADIVSKRYLANIDRLIHDEKLATETAKIGAEDESWTAKIAALAADRAALDTLSTKVTAETQKAGARISEIQAYIQTEGYNLSAVDIEIAEKEIQSSKVDIEKLDAANAVLRIQIDTVNAAQRLVDVDVQIARTKVDISQTNREMARIDLLPNDLSIAQAQTGIAEGELPIAAARVTLAEAKTAEVEREIAFEGTLLTQAATEYANKIGLMNLKQTGRTTELTQHREEKELEITNRLALSGMDVTFANLDAGEQEAIDVQKVAIKEMEVNNVQTKCAAAIETATTLAAANISTTLTHTIQKKAT